jgi:hypothetical protein
VVASRFVSPEKVDAANGQQVLVGGTHSGTIRTAFLSSGTAAGVSAHSTDGVGVSGYSDDTTPSTFASASHRTGVVGIVGNAIGINPTTDEVGVYAFADVSDNSAGVWGDTPNGAGVVGTGYWGVYGNGRVGVMGDVSNGATGVYGFVGSINAPTATAGVGVVARAVGNQTGLYGFAGDVAAPAATPGVAVEARAGAIAQTALQVAGKVKFSRSGRTSIAAAASSKQITMSGVTTSSYIIATLQTRRTGVYVSAVVPNAGYFTIYLNKAVTATTYVGYFVIN